jgi:hypothetical protein
VVKRTDTCPRCGTKIRPGLVGCKACWYALPADIRDRILEHYQPRQNALTASAEYQQAYIEALNWYGDHPISDELRDQLAASLDHQRQQR